MDPNEGTNPMNPNEGTNPNEGLIEPNKDCPSEGKDPTKPIDKKDYIKQTMVFHPDKNKDCQEDASKKFQTLGNLYSELTKENNPIGEEDNAIGEEVSAIAEEVKTIEDSSNEFRYAIIQINTEKEISVLNEWSGDFSDKSPYDLLSQKTPSVFAIKITKKNKGDCTSNSNTKCIIDDSFESAYELNLTIIVNKNDLNENNLINEDFLNTTGKDKDAVNKEAVENKLVVSNTNVSNTNVSNTNVEKSAEEKSAEEKSAEEKSAEEKPVINPVVERRGVPNVGNSCWANGIYQLLYDAEDFRNYIITTDWKRDFFTTNSDKLSDSTTKIGTLTQTEKTRKTELENKNPLTPEEEKEHEALNLKQDTSDWSWVPKNMTPEEYANLFGNLLKQIFKYIRGDNDIQITYETTLFPVVLFPDDHNRQQDSREFIDQLKIKTDGSIDTKNSPNLLDINKQFGFNAAVKRYYVDDSNTKTNILLSELVSLSINIKLEMMPEDENKTDLTVQKYMDSKTEDSDFNLKDTSIDEIQKMNTTADKTELENIKNKGTVNIKINEEYSNFSKYLLVTLVREKAGINGGQPTKQTTKVVFDEKITVNNSNFELIGIVVHSGETPKSGHYFYESIQDNHEYNDSTKGPLYNYSNKESIEKNWTILLYKNISENKEVVIEKKQEVVVGGSRKKRGQKSKKTKRKYYVYKK